MKGRPALSEELAGARVADLYGRHARAILGYALRRTGNPEDAADVVAETFLIAWRRLADVPVDEDARPWLYGTARFVLANQGRSARRRDRLTERLRDEVRRQLPAHHPPRGGALREALAELEEGDRELLMLVGWEELTPTQAARALGISPVAARSRLHRARRRLRDRLAEHSPSSARQGEIGVEEAR